MPPPGRHAVRAQPSGRFAGDRHFARLRGRQSGTCRGHPDRGRRFAGEVLAPLNSTGDRQGCRWFDGKVAKWNQWDFFRKCSLLIHHWPAIAARIKRGKAPAFRHIPLSWHEKAKLRKVSTDDPKKHKIERKTKPQRTARKPAAPKKLEPPIAREPNLLNLMVAAPREGRLMVAETYAGLNAIAVELRRRLQLSTKPCVPSGRLHRVD
jgi:hypothetical protein